jgi:hypothetical protein
MPAPQLSPRVPPGHVGSRSHCVSPGTESTSTACDSGNSETPCRTLLPDTFPTAPHARRAAVSSEPRSRCPWRIPDQTCRAEDRYGLRHFLDLIAADQITRTFEAELEIPIGGVSARGGARRIAAIFGVSRDHTCDANWERWITWITKHPPQTVPSR